MSQTTGQGRGATEMTRSNVITSNLGRHVFGAAAIAFGLVALFRHNFDDWQQLQSLLKSPAGLAAVYATAVLEITGGLAIQWRRMSRWGAGMLGVVHVFFACRWIPVIAADPSIYDSWGNLGEETSLITGALFVFAAASPDAPWVAKAYKLGHYMFGLCVVSFTIGQIVYLRGVASFTPQWLPPGPMFWAMFTTVAMGAAAIAIFTGYQSLLASRLLTLMFAIFGILVWLLRLIHDPANDQNWGGNAENTLLTGAAWIYADYLGRAWKSGAPPPRF